MPASKIEDRLTLLEKEVADLKQRLRILPAQPDWIDQVTGSMKDQPEFEEVLRLGKEQRDAESTS